MLKDRHIQGRWVNAEKVKITNLLLSSWVEIQVKEGKLDPLSRLSLQFVIAEHIVRVHAGICGGQESAPGHLLTLYSLATDVWWGWSAHKVGGWNKKKKCI